MTSNLLTARQVRHILQVSDATLRRMSRSGRLPAPIRMGTSFNAERRWRPEAIRLWLAEREQEAGHAG